MPPDTTLDDLPVELHDLILSYISTAESMDLRCVCRLWSELLRRRGTWLSLLREEFPALLAGRNEQNLVKALLCRSYKEAYEKLMMAREKSREYCQIRKQEPPELATFVEAVYVRYALRFYDALVLPRPEGHHHTYMYSYAHPNCRYGHGVNQVPCECDSVKYFGEATPAVIEVARCAHLLLGYDNGVYKWAVAGEFDFRLHNLPVTGPVDLDVEPYSSEFWARIDKSMESVYWAVGVCETNAPAAKTRAEEVAIVSETNNAIAALSDAVSATARRIRQQLDLPGDLCDHPAAVLLLNRGREEVALNMDIRGDVRYFNTYRTWKSKGYTPESASSMKRARGKHRCVTKNPAGNRKDRRRSSTVTVALLHRALRRRVNAWAVPHVNVPVPVEAYSVEEGSSVFVRDSAGARRNFHNCARPIEAFTGLYYYSTPVSPSPYDDKRTVVVLPGEMNASNGKPEMWPLTLLHEAVRRVDVVGDELASELAEVLQL